MDAARRTEDEKNRIPTIASAHRSRSSALPSLGAKGDVAKYAKSKRAIAYLVNNEAPLRVFLDDPAVPIDNNTAEQKMRRVALGRNNILFAGSANGGKADGRPHPRKVTFPTSNIKQATRESSPLTFPLLAP